MFKTPPGTGTVPIYIASGMVESNEVEFTYTTEQVEFATAEVAAGPFVVVEYCHGFLFTSEYSDSENSGLIKQWTVEENNTVTLVAAINVVQTSAPKGATTVLGLNCDPFQPDDDFDVYIHHSKLFQLDTGSVFPEPAPGVVGEYLGYISKINSAQGFSELMVCYTFTNSSSGR